MDPWWWSNMRLRPPIASRSVGSARTIAQPSGSFHFKPETEISRLGATMGYYACIESTVLQPQMDSAFNFVSNGGDIAKNDTFNILPGSSYKVDEISLC
jgi:hypothetical protein